MKHLSTLLVFCLFSLSACGHAPDTDAEQNDLRFHMSFNNQTHNDLDLHVVEPGGKHLNLKLEADNSLAQLGNDCTCGVCPDGPEETVLWKQKQAGKGIYEIWVQQSKTCGDAKIDSDFTLYVFERDQLKATLEGKLQQGQSQTLYYEFGS